MPSYKGVLCVWLQFPAALRGQQESPVSTVRHDMPFEDVFHEGTHRHSFSKIISFSTPFVIPGGPRG